MNKKRYLFIFSLIISMVLTACNSSEDSFEEETKDKVAPIFLNATRDHLDRITHQAGETVDVFKGIEVVDNETKREDILLEIIEDDGYEYNTPGFYTLKIAAIDEVGNKAYAYRRVVVQGELEKVEGDLIIEDKVIGDIPLTIRYKEGEQDRPVIFYFHGFGSNKDSGDQGRGEKLAALGYLVVSMDAYKHGDRSKEWFDALDSSKRQKSIVDITMQTAYDAKDVYDYVLDNYNVNDELYAFGVSMGAATTFYLSSITDVNGMVSMLGSPSFVEFYEYKASQFDWEKDETYSERLERYYDKDPLINHERLSSTNIFMSIGESDTVVPLEYAFDLYLEMDSSNVIYEPYATGHVSTPEMLDDVYLFLMHQIRHLYR